MKHFLAALSLLLSISALAQVPQGTLARATNAILFGVPTVATRLLATNTAGTNHFAGTLNVRSNIASQAIFYGDGSGLTNIGGAFTNLPFQDLSMSLNTFGDSIVSGEAGPPGWVYTMKTNLSDVTEIINYGGSGYQQHNVTAAFLASGGHTNEPYLMEVAYNGYTANPTVDGSNRLYWISVAVSNTPSPKRFLLLQMPNDQSSSNSTARFAFTTNLNAQIAALYPNNYYAWWDWFKMQTNGSAQDDADFAAGIPPSSLMQPDGIHPSSLGNYRLGTNMAGIWRAVLRSYQEPLLTGDLPTLFRGLTNITLSVKNLTVGGDGDLYEASAILPDGSIRMDNTNGAIFWQGTNLYGGLAWYSPYNSPNSAFLRTINVDPENGDLQIGQTSFVSPTVDFSVDSAGNSITRGIAYAPGINLGPDTSAVARQIASSAVGSDIAAMYLSTRSTSADIPRIVITTSESGSPGLGRVIITNANLDIASGFTTYGDMSGVSNAVTLIAGGCISITTNADGRTFTLSISGSGDDVLTNNRSGATLDGLTLTGVTTATSINGSGAVTDTNKWTQIVYEGDSLTAPTNETRTNYYITTDPYYASLVTPSPATTNLATGGDSITNMVVTYPAQVRPWRPKSKNESATVFIWAGINDILGTSPLAAGRSAAAIWTDLTNFYAMARADRFRVVVFTIAPSTSLSGGTETIRQTINSNIRANTSLYDFLIEPDVLFPNPANAADYSDGLHLTTLASAKLGTNIYTIVGIPTSSNIGMVDGIVPAANLTYGSIGKISGDLGLNEDVLAGSATFRFGQTVGGTLRLASGPTTLLALNSTTNTITVPTIFADTTDATAVDTGSLQVRGGVSIGKGVWVGSTNGGVITGQRTTATTSLQLLMLQGYNGVTRVGQFGIYGSSAVDDGEFGWLLQPSGGGLTRLMTLRPNGRLLLGSTTDNGTDSLQITGSGFFSGTVKATPNSTAASFARNRTSGTVNVYDTYALSGSIKAFVGIAGDTAGLASGTVAGGFVIRSESLGITLSGDGGTTASLRVNSDNSVSAARTITATNGFAGYATNFVSNGTFTDGFTNSTAFGAGTNAMVVNIGATSGTLEFYNRSGLNGQTVCGVGCFTNILTATSVDYSVGVNQGFLIRSPVGTVIVARAFP